MFLRVGLRGRVAAYASVDVGDVSTRERRGQSYLPSSVFITQFIFSA